MAKDAFYFSHDYNARNDEKILELRATYGAEGYGVFWMIIETMAENENTGLKRSLMAGLSLSYGIGKDKLCQIIESCLSIGLLYEKDGFLFSKRLFAHKELRLEKSAERSASGKLGAEKRWHSYNGAMAKDGKGKESTGKERVS